MPSSQLASWAGAIQGYLQNSRPSSLTFVAFLMSPELTGPQVGCPTTFLLTLERLQLLAVSRHVQRQLLTFTEWLTAALHLTLQTQEGEGQVNEGRGKWTKQKVIKIRTQVFSSQVVFFARINDIFIKSLP